MGFHEREEGREAVEVIVTVVEVVDESGVGSVEPAEDRELVLWFAKPAAVVIESNGAPNPGRLIGDGLEDADGRGNLLGLVARARRRVLHRDPELGPDV